MAAAAPLPPEAGANPDVSRIVANPAPLRRSGEGAGPFRKMVIRGAILIDGTGAPPRGPVDIVVENDRIAEILVAGTPGLPLKDGRAPRDFDYELDATGMYVLPGFIDMHAHGSSIDKAPDLSYSYKLWLAHGVTAVRGVQLSEWDVSSVEKARSARNEIVAPRIFDYQRLGAAWGQGTVRTPERARAWVRWAAKNGIDGIKFSLSPTEVPEVVKAALEEAEKLGLGTTAHLSQIGVARMNARQAGDLGLGTVTHFYGHMESLLKSGAIQDVSTDYNFYDEQYRFGEVADIWDEIHEPGTPEWKEYLAHQKENGIVFDPTMTIYAASRDLMKARNADWHDKYTMPQLWNYFQSNRENHGSYFFDWTTRHEVQWRNFYKRFMALMNDYKNMGGRVVTGTDSGFIYKSYGFGFPEEMELLQEAGFNPHEVIQAATLNGALTLYEPKGIVDPPIGTVRVGKLADLVIVKENPLQNFKTLYGTGTPRLNESTQRQERVGGVSYTVKDGIVYDAKKLLAEVADMVVAEKRRLGMPEQGLPRP
ncbi:amidohydrolase family protein [Sphingosinicella rhizophila]|uniref:Amidohydrolase family protein n=1 Tax=Sphingosinicella rhizophila TaxID=3050082 RepID=A0ABU3Q8E1_9SPHN|nr:amidohydrolase family protein [Sphingosinicella sp. GR2756]MDT9599200.1 amidohydrolase family protein [Sphingosinicella sp. GR2756]